MLAVKKNVVRKQNTHMDQSITHKLLPTLRRTLAVNILAKCLKLLSPTLGRPGIVSLDLKR